MIWGVFSQSIGTSKLVTDLPSGVFCCNLVDFFGRLFGSLAFTCVLFPLGFTSRESVVCIFLWVSFRSTHPIDHYPVDLFSQIERWLVSLAETGKIFRQVEICGRVDVGT